jgi:hypothetical protein
MPALLPVLLLGTQVLLAADAVPRFDTSLSCKSAGAAAVMGGDQKGARNTAACEQDERDAHVKLDQEWGSYNAAQREHCVSMSTLGGSPSYVELLTCLEIAKAASQLPPSDRMGNNGGIGKN